MKYKLLLGDCIDKMKLLPNNSIDSIVTDPPYGLTSEKVYSSVKQIDDIKGTGVMKQNLEDNTCYGSLTKGFMGKEWDGTGIQYNIEMWKECLRVLKPGGHLLSFGGTRTYHRMACAIEDAGFEIRDCIQWIYGQGFPKSLNIQKQINKKYEKVIQSKEYSGFGTSLKPATEPIVLARKPISEKTISDNVLKWGTGGINIDVCRIEFTNNETDKRIGTDITCKATKESLFGDFSNVKDKNILHFKEGRFPANVILSHHPDCIETDEKIEIIGSDSSFNKNDYDDNLSGSTNFKRGNYRGRGTEQINKWICHEDCPIRIMDEQSGILKANKNMSPFKEKATNNIQLNSSKEINRIGYEDKGGASRFFYCAKTSKKDRNEGCEELEEKTSELNSGGIGRKCSVEKRLENNGENAPSNFNIHPTVKPTSLMRYLCKLITPKGGVILDPFLGSGSTGKAAILEGFNFIGIEKEEEYFLISSKRINFIVEKIKNNNV
jgi:site-specific DNA-methyltransferase (adenine-specific)